MRKTLTPTLEAARVVPGNGISGMYRFPYLVADGPLAVIADDGELSTTRWDHVSVSHKDKIPSWETMEKIRRMFFTDEETVVQIHPPIKDYVNTHPFVLHLWRKTDAEHPLPPRELI